MTRAARQTARLQAQAHLMPKMTKVINKMVHLVGEKKVNKYVFLYPIKNFRGRVMLAAT